LNFSQQFLEKYSECQNPYSGELRSTRTDGWTDMTLKFAFCNFANAPEKEKTYAYW